MREVRSGTGSRDFDSLPEGQKEVKKECCFVVLYGSEFNLRTLSIEGESSVSFPDCIMGKEFNLRGLGAAGESSISI